MTFIGEKRWEKDAHPHESPMVMTIPLMVLAALSVIGGLLLLNDWIVDWLEPVVGPEPHEDLPLPALAISVLAVVVVAIGAAIAWFSYRPAEMPRWRPPRSRSSPRPRAPTSTATPSTRPSSCARASTSRAWSTSTTGRRRRRQRARPPRSAGPPDGLRRLQTGFVRSYALSMLAGAALVVLALLAVNSSRECCPG